jgi:hypothetical protein
MALLTASAAAERGTDRTAAGGLDDRRERRVADDGDALCAHRASERPGSSKVPRQRAARGRGAGPSRRHGLFTIFEAEALPQ